MPDFSLECIDCGHRALSSGAASKCPRCGSEWQEARYEYASIGPGLNALLAGRAFNLWRYQELLPVRNPSNVVSLGEGGSPLVHGYNLGLMLGRPSLYIKDERQGPAGSFKDRQATLVVSMMKENGVTEAVAASTGNVAISYSAYCARAGIKLWAFLTSMVPPDKMREVALYGTQVVKVTGTYDRAKELAAEFARQRNLFYDRGARNIAAVESMKTLAFECAEQLTRLLGLAPIFGKQALREGMDIFALVVLRTSAAALILWGAYAIFARRYMYIYPAGLIACGMAGFVNGVGSLLYYSGLARLDASLAQLLYTTNPLFLAILLRLDGQPISRLTATRMIIAFPAIAFLLTGGSQHVGQTIGMMLMLFGRLLYALHLAITQRALRDMPSQTVTLYTVTAMAITVIPSALAIRLPLTHTPPVAFVGAVGLTLVTVISRLLLFVSVKHLGGLQAALLGLSELLVSIATAFVFFGEQLTATQWAAAIALMISVALVSREQNLNAHHISEGWLAWIYGVMEGVRWPEKDE